MSCHIHSVPCPDCEEEFELDVIYDNVDESQVNVEEGTIRFDESQVEICGVGTTIEEKAHLANGGTIVRHTGPNLCGDCGSPG